MAKTEYDILKETITAKVKEAGGSRHSKGDFTQMTHTLLNTPDQEVTTYIKDVNDPVVTKPVQAYRESLKPVLKQFGVDNAELDKIQQVKFDKNAAEAFNDLATQVVKDYTGTGRKLILPINSTDEAQMEIRQETKKETNNETKKLVQKPDGSYESVPTGKKKKTKAHKELKVSNKVPGWLVEETEI